MNSEGRYVLCNCMFIIKIRYKIPIEFNKDHVEENRKRAQNHYQQIVAYEKYIQNKSIKSIIREDFQPSIDDFYKLCSMFRFKLKTLFDQL